MTSSYRRNGYKTNRNNSISILFLICRLLTFKANKGHVEEENIRHPLSPQQNDSTNELDISQKIKNLSFKDQQFGSFDQLDSLSSINLDQHIESDSTLDQYVTAIGSIENSIWRVELETAMLDYPLQHYYPQVSEMVVFALKVSAFFFCFFLLLDLIDICLLQIFGSIGGCIARKESTKVIIEFNRITGTGC